MRRFFVQAIPPGTGTFVITGSEARHITRVLRMGVGDRLVLMDQDGYRVQSRIEAVQGRSVTVLLERPLPAPHESPVAVTLCQALLKARAMDFVIQKASELGVRHILPFTSERTVVRVDQEKPSSRIRHWREIAVNASKQSDRAKPPEVALPCSLPALLERLASETAVKLLLWEDEKSQDLKALIKERSARPGAVMGIVGPEGGFGLQEVERIRRAGFVSVSLGNRVLRAETAAVALAAILQYEWGDLSLSSPPF